MNKLLLVASCFIGLSGVAQENLKRIKTQSVTLMPFVNVSSAQVVGLEDFQKLAPNSTILPENLDDYKSFDKKSNGLMAGSGVLLGFKFLNKNGDAYKANPVLRIGLSAGVASNLHMDVYKDERFAHDTLVSVNTGERTAIDSVAYSSYYLDYLTTQVRVDASLIFSTNPAARWKFYSGGGLSVGMSFSNATEVYHSAYSYLSPSGDNAIVYYNRNQKNQIQSEAFLNQSAIVGAGYIPVGVDFTISKKNKFWKKMHLFYEGRGGIDIVNVPELRTYTSLFGQHSFGLKVQWE